MDKKSFGRFIVRVGVAFGFGATMWLIVHGGSAILQLLGCVNLGVYFTILMHRFDYVDDTNELCFKLIKIVVDNAEEINKK